MQIWLAIGILAGIGVNVHAQNAPEIHLVSTANAKTEVVEPVMWLPGNVISRLDASVSSELSGQLLFLTEIGFLWTEYFGSSKNYPFGLGFYSGIFYPLTRR